jgi:putative phage-type endonuclease
MQSGDNSNNSISNNKNNPDTPQISIGLAKPKVTIKVKKKVKATEDKLTEPKPVEGSKSVESKSTESKPTEPKSVEIKKKPSKVTYASTFDVEEDEPSNKAVTKPEAKQLEQKKPSKTLYASNFNVEENNELPKTLPKKVNVFEKKVVVETKKEQPLDNKKVYASAFNVESADSDDMDDYPMYIYTAEKPFTPIKMTQPEYGPYGTQWIHDKQTNDVLSDKEKRLSDVLDGLLDIEYPEQRSKGWFRMRDGKITASDGGCVLGDNSYEAEYKFLLKKVNKPPFNGGEACYNGKKFERIATMIYEYRMNVYVEEFGLVGHPTYDFLGASPDGIVGKYKLDKKSLTKYVGRMIEIKCPLSRKIKTSGPIKDHICPIYYWDQVQLQLECCDLDECDFWQCELEHYKNRKEFIDDTDASEPFRTRPKNGIKGQEKGCLIQLLPMKYLSQLVKTKTIIKNNEEFDVDEIDEEKYKETIYEYASFIYPPKIEMSPQECDLWINETLANLPYDKKYAGLVFDKVIYWKLRKAHNVVIEREKEWFAEKLPILKKMWDYVLFFRSNPNKMKLLTDYLDSMIMKTNTKVMKMIADIYNCKTNEEFKLLEGKINEDMAKNTISKEQHIQRKMNQKNESSSFKTYMFD